MQGLLMIDMQKAFDNSSWGERNNPQLEVNSQKLLNFFREKGWPVLHVQHVSENTQSRFHVSQGQDFKDGFQPCPGEPVFQKIVNSAFIGTNLYYHTTVDQEQCTWNSAGKNHNGTSGTKDQRTISCS